MSKKRWHLKSISQVLRSMKEKKNPPPPLSHRRMPLDDFSKLLIQQIKAMDKNIEILERNFPIQEGREKVDLLAFNQGGDLIMIWTQEVLKAQRLLDLISQFDWMKKNIPLWQHLFPQASKKGELQIKVWFFAGEIDSNLDTVLSYLKGIPLRVFQYSERNWSHEPALLLKAWMHLKTESTPLPADERHPAKANAKNAHLRALPPPKEIPSITQEEIKDLMQGVEIKSSLDADLFEDEITEPFFPLNDLKSEKA